MVECEKLNELKDHEYRSKSVAVATTTATLKATTAITSTPNCAQTSVKCLIARLDFFCPNKFSLFVYIFFHFGIFMESLILFFRITSASREGSPIKHRNTNESQRATGESSRVSAESSATETSAAQTCVNGASGHSTRRDNVNKPSSLTELTQPSTSKPRQKYIHINILTILKFNNQFVHVDLDF